MFRWSLSWGRADTGATRPAPFAEIEPASTHEDQFELVLGDMRRRMQGQDRRMTSAESRSHTLIASSAIFAGLLVVTPVSFDVLVALTVNIAAAAFGIVAIYPRAVPELDPAGIRQEVLSKDPEAARLYLVDQYLSLIEDREDWISTRMRIVRAGLMLLVSSLILAAIAISRSL